MRNLVAKKVSTGGSQHYEIYFWKWRNNGLNSTIDISIHRYSDPITIDDHLLIMSNSIGDRGATKYDWDKGVRTSG